MKYVAVAAVFFFSVGDVFAQTAAQKACVVSAFTEYNAANLAVLQNGISIEVTLSQRRLQEQFCLRFATCMVGNIGDLPLSTVFSKCLRDEGAEK